MALAEIGIGSLALGRELPVSEPMRIVLVIGSLPGRGDRIRRERLLWSDVVEKRLMVRGRGRN